jgi:hypothetical protein
VGSSKGRLDGFRRQWDYEQARLMDIILQRWRKYEETQNGYD